MELGHFITQTFEHKKPDILSQTAFFVYFFFCAVKVFQKSETSPTYSEGAPGGAGGIGNQGFPGSPGQLAQVA